MALNIKGKLVPATNMPNIATHSLAPDWKEPIDPERVEKPPEESVVRAWITLSTQGIPARRYAMANKPVRPT
jgi:hypothetical protein